MEEQVKKLSAIRTIDLRIDFMRPGVGKEFFITGTILSEGKRILVNRMDFRNEQDILIATGIGTFLVA
jgi:acyl-coenzyme A thioesterase PaaI-like protein